MARPKAPAEYKVMFHFECNEYPKSISAAMPAASGKYVEHHISLRLGGRALNEDPFVLAIRDHSEYFPNHSMLGVHIGGVHEVADEEKRRDPLREGKVEWKGGKIDR